MNSAKAPQSMQQLRAHFRAITREVSSSDLPLFPGISVLVPTFQQGRQISDCIESILAQVCMEAVEIVVADECSQDSTVNALLALQGRYPARIRLLLSREYPGVGWPRAALNLLRLQEAARAPLLAFAEGDDLWHHTLKLQWGLEQLNAWPEVMLTAHTAGNAGEEEAIHALPDARLTLSELLATWPLRLGTLMIRRSFWDEGSLAIYRQLSCPHAMIPLHHARQGVALAGAECLSTVQRHNPLGLTPNAQDQRLLAEWFMRTVAR